MGVLDLLRGAIAPAAAARVGYLQGQEQETDKQRAIAMQDAALHRQSVLDQIKAQVDQSTITRNRSQADRNDRMPQPQRMDYDQFVDENGRVMLRNRHDPKDVRPMLDDSGAQVMGHTPNEPQPHEIIDSDDEYRRWDADSKTYVKTGIKARKRAPRGGLNGQGATSQDRLDAKTALDELTRMTPHPSKYPKTVTNPDILNAKPGVDVKKLPVRVDNPEYTKTLNDSLAYEGNVLGPARQHLVDVTIGDKVRIGGVSAPGKSPNPGPKSSMSGTDTKLNSAQSSAMQAEMDRASTQLQTILSNPQASDADKASARRAYNKRQAAIAKSYGAGMTPE